MTTEEDTRWMRAASCRNAPKDLWFPENKAGAQPKANRDPYAAAKAVCDRCLVANECLAYALKMEIAEGMWGGTAPEVRRRMRRSSVRS